MSYMWGGLNGSAADIHGDFTWFYRCEVANLAGCGVIKA
jgi:hypothetical protein